MPNRQRIMVAAVALHLQLAVAQEPQPLPSQPMTPAEIKSEPALAPTGLPGEDLQLETVTPSQLPAAPPERMRFQAPHIRPVLPAISPGINGVNQLSGVGNLYVVRFEFQGNHVFSGHTLAKVIQDYTGRQITAEDLEQARQSLTTFYVSNGYISSGAVLDDQDTRRGVITFRIVEGRLTDIKLSRNRWFRSFWLKHEFRRAAGNPMNFNKLKEGLELLRQNPLISQVNGELKPGGAPGESVLDTQVKDTQPFRIGLDFNNSRPPSVGSEILNAHFADLNLLGLNDPLHLDYGILEGTRNSQGFRASGWDNEDGSYSIGITPWDTAFQIHGSKSNTAIVEAPFNTLNITSRLEEYGYALRQPLYETLTDDVAVSVALDSERDKTFLLGMPFSLSPGAVNGVSDVTVLRFIQEYVNRSTIHVLAIRSTFNLGINALGATINNSGQDGRFFSWLTQTQYVRRIHDTDNLLVVRVNGQISNSPLLAPEQFSLGGAESVRGYRENELLRDDGWFASIEVRIPVIHGKAHSQILALAPFFDLGAGWNTLSGQELRNPQGIGSLGRQADTLPSLGIGLIFTPSSHIHSDLYWGYGFNREFIVADKTDPQDYGLYFNISVDAF
jgi:hemolysin activation/secretion protein